MQLLWECNHNSAYFHKLWELLTLSFINTLVSWLYYVLTSDEQQFLHDTHLNRKLVISLLYKKMMLSEYYRNVIGLQKSDYYNINLYCLHKAILATFNPLNCFLFNYILLRKCDCGPLEVKHIPNWPIGN